MIRLRHKLTIQSFRLFDQALLWLCLIAVMYVLPETTWRGGLHGLLERAYSLGDSLGVVILAVAWFAIFNYLIRYNANRFIALRTQILDYLRATTAATLVLLVIGVFFDYRRITTVHLFLFWSATTGLGILSRLVIRRLLLRVRKSGLNYRYLLIIGNNARSHAMAAKLEASPELGYKIVGFIAEPGAAAPLSAHENGGCYLVVGQLDELRPILEKGTVDELLICLPIEDQLRAISMVIRTAQELGIVARLIPEPSEAILLSKLHIEVFHGDYVLTLFREQLLLQLLVKRIADVLISATLLVLLSPLLLAVAFIIKITSPGPVIFAQERMGMNRRRFRLFKFRSMVADAEQIREKLAHLNEMDGPAFKVKNDPRITPIGRFIRKTSIDELPQLVNVLRGEMSLVGPRPPLPHEVDAYEWLYRRRLSIKPGLTCLWQVNGRNGTTFHQWMEMDREYIDNWSLWLDFKILLKTIPAVMIGRGAS